MYSLDETQNKVLNQNQEKITYEKENNIGIAMCYTITNIIT